MQSECVHRGCKDGAGGEKEQREVTSNCTLVGSKATKMAGQHTHTHTHTFSMNARRITILLQLSFVAVNQASVCMCFKHMLENNLRRHFIVEIILC